VGNNARIRSFPCSRLAVALLATGVLCGCSTGRVPTKTAAAAKPSPVVPPGGVLLQGAGATFPYALYEKWFSLYQSAHPKTVVSYEAVGSGEGIRRFLGQNVKDEEKVAFGASDAAMRDDEIATVPDGVILLPVTAGGVALAYNLPDVSADLKLSRQVYAGIFMGDIKDWNDRRIVQTNPGVKLPNLTITTVVRQDGSGTTFAFTKHLDSISEAWRSRYGAATLINWPGNSMRATGNEGVAGKIVRSVGSIGYVSYESARKAGLKMALLENKAKNFIAPSANSSASALATAELPENLRLYIPDPVGDDSYPIVTLTWILLHRSYFDPQKAQAIHDLFQWCLTEGQGYAPELGYTPLPPNVVSRSLAALDSLQMASAQNRQEQSQLQH
jgi:phosphate transport system substrate-binding protein